MPCIRYRFTSGALYRWEFERGGIEVDIDVEGPLTLNDQDLMVDAALDGAGLAFVFEAQAEELIAKRKLVRVLADWCPAYPGFFLYYPSRRQLPAALRAFVDFARTANYILRISLRSIRATLSWLTHSSWLVPRASTSSTCGEREELSAL